MKMEKDYSLTWQTIYSRIVDTIERYFFFLLSFVLSYIYVKCNLSLKRFTNEEIKVLCRLKA